MGLCLVFGGLGGVLVGVWSVIRKIWVGNDQGRGVWDVLCTLQIKDFETFLLYTASTLSHCHFFIKLRTSFIQPFCSSSSNLIVISFFPVLLPDFYGESIF